MAKIGHFELLGTFFRINQQELSAKIILPLKFKVRDHQIQFPGHQKCSVPPPESILGPKLGILSYLGPFFT